MTRLIKRYGSRKLYDTTESRYILLEDIADFVRNGQEIHVIDNKSGEDVTGQTLTQVISEEGRKKANFLSSELLHDLIRAGETVVSSRVQQLQSGVEGFMKKSFDRLVPLRTVRDEMNQLQARMSELEEAISRAESLPEADKPAEIEAPETEATPTPKAESPAEVEAKPKTTRKTAAKRVTRKKPATTRKTSAPNTEKASDDASATK